MAARAVLKPSLGGAVIHAYFHDTDLLSGRRRRSLTATLALLGHRCWPIDLDELAHVSAEVAPKVSSEDVLKGRSAAAAQ